jgi:altronate hydrolase
MTPPRLTLRLHPADNVAVAVADLIPGAPAGDGVVARQVIAKGHKVAQTAIAADAPIIKYSQIIGFATGPIAAGEHVHTHNCAMRDVERDYAFGSDLRATAPVPEAERATFQGIRRADGRVATRNYVAVLTTVNCSASVARMIAEAFRGDALAAFPNVDGVIALTHGAGCGADHQTDDMPMIRRTIAGYARHPNVAAALIVGLGCEVNQLSGLVVAEDLRSGDRLQFMNIQETGGTRATVAEGVARIRAMLPMANDVTRTPEPASHLTLALQCGGSDGFSGISANPSLGAAADLLVTHGGTAILSETPEIYGAEHLLTRHAATRAVGEALVERVRWWQGYTAARGARLDGNPSPGNKAGGLTTILEKSLGAAAKGGTTNLMGVFRYAEPITTKGFVFMDSPGYDPCSVTGQVASGANVVCFTTGRGSVFGCKPVPSLKLATNSDVYRRMTEDMDINCGAVIDEGVPVAAMGRLIFERILAVASGEQSKSEALGIGDAEFVPWQVGATL